MSNNRTNKLCIKTVNLAKIYIKEIGFWRDKMDIGNMKNMIVLKNLPSNLIDEAIVVLKENKTVKKYQYIESDKKQTVDYVNKQDEKTNKTASRTDYIIKEAEDIIGHYITNLETKSPKWKNNMKKLEKRYKQSVKLNFILGIMTVISIMASMI